ncbi:MAG: hypothetical protein ABSD64_01510 [Terriglobales bacterium]|jgi:hypothetical protein
MSKDQHEEEAILRFTSYLQDTTGVSFGVTGRDVPVPSGQNYDYELTGVDGDKLAVELFRLVESEQDLKRQKAWSRVIQKLKDEVLRRKLKGYMVSTPVFMYKKRELDAYVSQQADAIERAIKDDGDKKQFSAGGYEFNRIANLETIVFSYSPGGRAINPSGTAFEHFVRLLPVKNRQLATPGHRRCLLVANWAIFVDANDAIQALTSVDFSQFTNIDLIFYETSPGELSLIFSRSVYEAIRRRTVVSDAGLTRLLNQYLRYMLADKKDEAFQYVKAISAMAGNMQWLDDSEARRNLVMHAEAQLKEHDQIDKALWVLEMLHDDPDPDKEGANDPGDRDGSQNYHARILRNEDVRFITTVRGHLCWLMSQLVVQNIPEHYTRILEIIHRYAEEKNLYIRAQVTFPLTELVARRRATKIKDGSPFNWNREERLRVRDLAFRMLRENSAYPRVMESLLNVFNSLRDVNEAEAEEILTRFLATGQDYIFQGLAALVVYFALFRDKNWRDDAPFDRRRFVDILKNEIVSGGKSLRSSIAWHLWKIVSDKHLPYSDVKDYFPLFWEGTYDPHIVSMCDMAIGELTTIAPQDAVELFKRMVQKSLEHANENPAQSHWLSCTEKVIPLLTAQPSELVAVVSDLKDLWMKGGYIGDPITIFGSFRHVDPMQRDEVREGLKTIYGEMKAVHPRLVDVVWSD